MDAHADKHCEKAKKAVSTGLFKWSKDYVSAAIHYDQAAKIYFNTGQYDKVC